MNEYFKMAHDVVEYHFGPEYATVIAFFMHLIPMLLLGACVIGLVLTVRGVRRNGQ